MCAILTVLDSRAESAFLQRLLDLLPKTLDAEQKMAPGHFTRTRKLPFPSLITTILSLVANGQPHGVDTHLGAFFRGARRSGMWPEANTPQRSALSKARKKVPWTTFQDILNDAVQIAYDVWPEDPSSLWHGLSVFAIDGSKYTVPATEVLRQTFDPESGLGTTGQGHYPQCLVSTLYDVFRRLPVARTVAPVNGSERDEAEALLPSLPKPGILLFDRGYPSYDFIHLLNQRRNDFFVVRCPASCTFPAVEAFVASGQQEAIIWLTPSNNALKKRPRHQRGVLKAMQLRVVLLTSPDGTVSVLLTNLRNPQAFPREAIVALYFRRWEIEGAYRDEKVILDIERFHAQTPNGIRQELFAAMIMTVISRTMMIWSAKALLPDERECQFKNAIVTLASEAAFLVPEDPKQAVTIFREVLQDMARVIYYRPTTPRRSQPRINKHPLNTWSKRNRSMKTYPPI